VSVSADSLPHLASTLQVRGVYLRASTSHESPQPVPASSLDLRLWQTRFDEYLIAHQYGPRSRDSLRTELRPFFEHLHAQQVDSVANLTPVHLESYRLALFYLRYRGRRLSLSTQSHRVSAVKTFTHFLYQAGWTLVDAGASVPSITVPPRLPDVWLSETEVLQLLDTPPLDGPLALRNRAMLELFYSTALRSTELCELMLNDVDLRARELRIRHGKGGRSRLLPLGEEAYDWLVRYLDEVRPALLRAPSDTTVFLSVRGKPFCHVSLAVAIRDTADRAGLSKRVTPHVLRHACATHMLRRGASLRYVQALLGHASPDTTQRYTRVDITDLRTMHARFHPRGRG
jgi:integrase/recombinase XerD